MAIACDGVWFQTRTIVMYVMELCNIYLNKVTRITITLLRTRLEYRCPVLITHPLFKIRFPGNACLCNVMEHCLYSTFPNQEDAIIHSRASLTVGLQTRYHLLRVTDSRFTDKVSLATCHCPY